MNNQCAGAVKPGSGRSASRRRWRSWLRATRSRDVLVCYRNEEEQSAVLNGTDKMWYQTEKMIKAKPRGWVCLAYG